MCEHPLAVNSSYFLSEDSRVYDGSSDDRSHVQVPDLRPLVAPHLTMGN